MTGLSDESVDALAMVGRHLLNNAALRSEFIDRASMAGLVHSAVRRFADVMEPAKRAAMLRLQFRLQKDNSVHVIGRRDDGVYGSIAFSVDPENPLRAMFLACEQVARTVSTGAKS